MIGYFTEEDFRFYKIGEVVSEGYDFDHRPISYGTRIMLTHNVSVPGRILLRGTEGFVLIPDSAQPNTFNIQNMSATIYRGHMVILNNYELPVEVEPYKIIPLEEYAL